MWKCLWALVVAMGLAVCGVVQGQQPTAADKAALAKQIAPFLNSQTAILVHVNLDQLDVEALATFVEQSLANTRFPAEAMKELAQNIRGPRAMLKQYGERGFHDVYALVSFEIPTSGVPPIAFVVPMAAGTNEATFRQDLVEMVSPSGLVGKSPETMKLDGALAVGPPQVIGDATALVQRNETRVADATAMIAAMDSMGRHTVDIVVAPTPEMRRVVSELMPRLPQEIGGSDSTVLAEGMRYFAMTFKFPPAPQLTLRVQADSAARAARLLEVWNSLEKALAPFVVAAPAEIRTAASDVLAALKPKVEQSQLTTLLDSGTLAKAVLLLMPDVQAARDRALRTKSAYQAQQLIVAAIKYASDRQNQWPDELNAELLTKNGLKENALKNPRHPDQTPGYIYLKPKTGSTGNGERIVLYEKTAPTDDGVMVGFADGHVEWRLMKNFEEALRKQQAEDETKK